MNEEKLERKKKRLSEIECAGEDWNGLKSDKIVHTVTLWHQRFIRHWLVHSFGNNLLNWFLSNWALRHHSSSRSFPSFLFFSLSPIQCLCLARQSVYFSLLSHSLNLPFLLTTHWLTFNDTTLLCMSVNPPLDEHISRLFWNNKTHIIYKTRITNQRQREFPFSILTVSSEIAFIYSARKAPKMCEKRGQKRKKIDPPMAAKQTMFERAPLNCHKILKPDQATHL